MAPQFGGGRSGGAGASGSWSNSLEPELREGAVALVTEASRAGLQPRVTSARRSHSLQARLYRRYLRGESQFPAAPPGQSAHEYGWAFDVLVTPFAYLAELGRVWTAWGGTWGAERDPVHFELPGASEKAKSLGEEPVAQKYFFGPAFDFLVGFLPGVGPAEIFATVLQAFPNWTDNQILDFMSSPHKIFRFLHQRGYTPF